MTGRHPRLLAGLLLLGLAACTHYSLIPAERTKIGSAYSVDPQVSWNQSKDGEALVWTLNGPALESLRLYGDLSEGDALFTLKPDQEESFPKFEADMRESDVMEFVVDSYLRGGYAEAVPSGLRPVDFDTSEGFRFEMALLTEEGLEVDGLVIGALEEDRLYLIIYTGARIHYFPKSLPHVENLIGSVVLES